MNAAPPKTAAQLQKEALAAAAKNLKSQILARSASSASTASAGAGGSRLGGSGPPSGRASAAGSASGKKEVKTLDEYLAGERGGQQGAWPCVPWAWPGVPWPGGWCLLGGLPSGA